MSTGIEWTDETWNPVTGCDKVSPGCDHCYAETIAHRFDGTPAYPDGFKVTLRPERLDQPLRWKRPRMIFVNSMSDLFHKDIPDEYIARIFAVMALAQQHTFQILTKRHGRMRSLLSSPKWPDLYDLALRELMLAGTVSEKACAAAPLMQDGPLPNVWLGVSAEDRRWARVRIPALLGTPAAVRFVSAEPLLGPLDLYRYLPNGFGEGARWNPRPSFLPDHMVQHTLDWVIVGGESGHGARPMHPDWVRSIRDQCDTAGVPFFFKQWGQWSPDPASKADPDAMVGLDGTAHQPGDEVWIAETVGAVPMARVTKSKAGKTIDGRQHVAWPEQVTV